MGKPIGLSCVPQALAPFLTDALATAGLAGKSMPGQGDLFDALAGCQAVIHCHDPADPARAQSLLQALGQSDVERLLIVAPTPRYLPQASGIYREDDPRPAGDGADLRPLIRALLPATGRRPELVTLLPTLTYGPGDQRDGGALACFGPIYNAHVPALIGLHGGPRSNWVHLEDVARAAVHLLSAGQAGLRYHVGDGDAVAFGDLLDHSLFAHGLIPSLKLPYPQAVLRRALAADWFDSGLKRLTQLIWKQIQERHQLVEALEPSISPSLSVAAQRGAILLTERLLETGFEPRQRSILDAWQPVLSWYQRQRWVPTY